MPKKKLTQNELKLAVLNIKKEIGYTALRPTHLENLMTLCHEAYDCTTDTPRVEGYDRDYWLSVSRYIKMKSEEFLVNTRDIFFARLSDEALLWEAPQWFESYMLYMEKDKKPQKRFYYPRRKTLHLVAEALQDLEDRVIEFLGISLPARTGKSTICIFFLTWVMGKRPNSHSAMGGHSNPLVKGFFKEVLNIINSADYHFSEIFPNSPFLEKSAEDYTINLDKPDRFATLTCRGIDATWTGAVDVSHDGYLYVDDLVKDREESLSPSRLNDKYQTYLNVMVDRKNDGARELMVGTRWNLYDPLGRRKAQYQNNPKARFLEIPALNDNDESNFQYEYGLGFSTQYYREMRETLDSNEWAAKYQQRPFVREGLLFPENELKYFNGKTLREEYRIVACCDVAFGGGDSLSMPIAEVHGDDVYIVDWVFNNKDKFVTRPLVTGALLRNNVEKVQFEANNGGAEYAEAIGQMLKEAHGHIQIITKRTDKLNKENKIIQYSADVKNHFYFLEKGLRSPEYQRAMDELTTYVQLGKNLHDDSPDSLVQLYLMLTNGKANKLELVYNPLWY